MLVDAGGNVFTVVALHEHGHAAGGLDVLDGALHLAFALAKNLAAFIGDAKSKIIEIGLHKALQFEERLDAIDDRGATPLDEGARGGFGGLIDLFGRRQRDLGQHRGGGGVEDVE